MCASRAKLPTENANGRFDPQSIKDKLTKSEAALVARLGAAHNNAMESLPLYAGGIACAVASGVPASTLASRAAAFLGLRVAYTIAYAMPPKFKGVPRMVLWLSSVVVSISIYGAAAAAYTA